MKFSPLGSSTLELSKIGLGCWQFSNGIGMIGGMWGHLDQNRISAIVKTSVEFGINWFDTAELYGKGNSEMALATALQNTSDSLHNPYIATKWSPFGRFARNMKTSIVDRQRFLSPYEISLMQIHFPYGSLSTIETQVRTLCELVKDGKVQNAGVSNFKSHHLIKACSVMKKFGIPLLSNQVSYSLLNRRIERTDLLKICKSMNISIIAHSPLAHGMLSGKFHRDPTLLSSWSITRRILSFKAISLYKRSEKLISILGKIADSHSATTTQVALQALLQLNNAVSTFLIPGATSPEQAEQNAKALDFKLSNKELLDIETESRKFI